MDSVKSEGGSENVVLFDSFFTFNKQENPLKNLYEEFGGNFASELPKVLLEEEIVESIEESVDNAQLNAIMYTQSNMEPDSTSKEGLGPRMERTSKSKINQVENEEVHMLPDSTMNNCD